MAAPQDNEGDIDPIDNKFTVSELGEDLGGLSRSPSPNTQDPKSQMDSEDKTSPLVTRRNTMSGPAHTQHPEGTNTPELGMPELSQDQLQQVIAALSGGTRKPKTQEPEVLKGERSNLRGWPAQLRVHYTAVG